MGFESPAHRWIAFNCPPLTPPSISATRTREADDDPRSATPMTVWLRVFLYHVIPGTEMGRWIHFCPRERIPVILMPSGLLRHQ